MAIIRRLSDLKIISQNYEIRLYKKLSYHGYRKREPGDDFIPFERPSLFNFVFESMIENGDDPAKIFLDRMKIPGSDLDDLIGMEYFSKQKIESHFSKVVPLSFLQRNSD